jgi:hypothetical protein
LIFLEIDEKAKLCARINNWCKKSTNEVSILLSPALSFFFKTSFAAKKSLYNLSIVSSVGGSGEVSKICKSEI